MAAALLALAYLATGLVLAGLAGWWLRTGPSLRAACFLLVLPLVFTAAGFLPGRTLAPTQTLMGIAPWADPALAEEIAAGASPENPLLLDPLTQMLPWSRAARESLLFNPAQGAGSALLGNGQSAVLFPTEIASRWLPAPQAATYSQAARLLLAAWGMFVLLRWRSLGETAALVGASLFVGSGFVQLWRLHPHSLVAAMVPWILAAALDLARRPGPRSAAALGAAGALGVWAGHPETLLHGVFFAALAAVAGLGRRLLREGRKGFERAVQAGVWAVAAAALALLLAAPALLPFLDSLAVSSEWATRRERAVDAVELPLAEAVEHLATAVTPVAYGNPFVGVWQGPDNLVEMSGGAVGMVVLLLVPAALFDRRRRREAGLWLALGAVGLLVAAHLPWISKPFGAMPLLNASLLKRLSLWWVLGASFAGALGWEALGRGAPKRASLRLGASHRAALAHHRRAWPGILAGLSLAVAALALVAWALPLSRYPRGVPLEAAGLALGAVAVALARLGRPLRPLAAALLILALLGPRAALFSRWIPAVSAASFYPETPAVRWVRARVVGPEGFRVAGLGPSLLPNAAVFLGLEDVRLYDPMGFAPLARYIDGLGQARPFAGVWITDPQQEPLRFLGVRYIFAHPASVDRPEESWPGLRVAYRGVDALVLEDPGALPRVFVPQWLEVRDGGEDDIEAALAFEAADRVTVGGSDLAAGERRNPSARVSEVTVTPGRIEGVVEAAATTVLATSQPAVPGWRVLRDGEEVTALRINGAFLGLEAPPGRSRFELIYAPAGWRWGWALWGLGAVAVLALCVRPHRALSPRGRRVEGSV